MFDSSNSVLHAANIPQSASYSSTAGALLTPISTSYGSGGPSEAAPELHRNTSPRSVSSSVASTAYTPSMTSTTLSPNIKVSAGLGASAGQSDLRVSVPQLAPTAQSMTPWQAAAHHPASQYSTGLSATGRTSWDYGAFLEPSAATGGCCAPGKPSSRQRGLSAVRSANLSRMSKGMMVCRSSAAAVPLNLKRYDLTIFS